MTSKLNGGVSYANAQAARKLRAAVEALECRKLLSFAAHINFTPSASSGVPTTPTEYFPDTGLSYQSQNELLYGWKDSSGTNISNSNTGFGALQTSNPDSRFNDARYMTWISMLQGASSDQWVMGGLVAGTYSVHLVVGSPTTIDGSYEGTINGVSWHGSQSANDRWIDVDVAVSVGANGLFTIDDPNGADNRLCYIDILSAPTAPSSLAATPSSTLPRVTLEWNDNSDNETAFILERATDIDFHERFVSTVVAAHNSTGTVTYTDRFALLYGYKYYYRVKAVNGNANQSASDYAVSQANPLVRFVTATTKPATPPAPTAQPWDGSLITLYWKYTGPAVTSFNILRRGPGETTLSVIDNIGGSGGGQTSFEWTDYDVSPGAQYEYAIEAIDVTATVRGPATTLLALPRLATPTVTAASSSKLVHLNWNAVSDAESYTITRSGGAAFTPVPAFETKYDDTTVQPGVEYTYQVVASDDDGEFQPSLPGADTVTTDFRIFLDTKTSTTSNMRAVGVDHGIEDTYVTGAILVPDQNDPTGHRHENGNAVISEDLVRPLVRDVIAMSPRPSILILDYEDMNADITSSNGTVVQVDDAISRIKEAMRWAHEEAQGTDLKIGFTINGSFGPGTLWHDGLPDRQRRSDDYLAGIDDTKEPGDPDYYEASHDLIHDTTAPEKNIDFLCPGIYTLTGQLDLTTWERQAYSLRDCKQNPNLAGVPVYAFMTNSYQQGADDLKPLSPDDWKAELAFFRRDCDGLVLWGCAPNIPDASNPAWWQKVQEFVTQTDDLPAVPSNPSLDTNGMHLTWTASTDVNPPTHYIIERTETATGKTDEFVTSNRDSWIDTSFVAGQHYSYRIKASDGLHESAYSLPVAVLPGLAERNATDENWARLFNDRQDPWASLSTNFVQGASGRWVRYDNVFFPSGVNQLKVKAASTSVHNQFHIDAYVADNRLRLFEPSPPGPGLTLPTEDLIFDGANPTKLTSSGHMFSTDDKFIEIANVAQWYSGVYEIKSIDPTNNHIVTIDRRPAQDGAPHGTGNVLGVPDATLTLVTNRGTQNLAEYTGVFDPGHVDTTNGNSVYLVFSYVPEPDFPYPPAADSVEWFQFGINKAPAAPGGAYTVGIAGTSNVAVHWQSRSSDATSFEVQGFTDPNFGGQPTTRDTVAADNGPEDNDYAVTLPGQSGNTPLYFQIVARNSYGDSAPAPANFPAPASDVQVTVLSPTSVRVTWTNHATNASEIYVDGYDDSTFSGLGNDSLIETSVGGGQSADLPGLTAGKTYYFMVRPHNNFGYAMPTFSGAVQMPQATPTGSGALHLVGLAGGNTIVMTDATLDGTHPGLIVSINGDAVSYYRSAFSDISLDTDGGDTVTADGGSVTFERTPRLASLTITGATVRLLPHGNSPTANVLVTGALSISGGGQLDVTDNGVIIDYLSSSPIGTWNGSAYSGVTGLIVSGRNGGSWDGSGIVNTGAPSGDRQSVGIAEASDVLGLTGSQTATWLDQTVDATAVLVRATYSGDATLDGIVDPDDYQRLQAGISAASHGWAHGDLNYDGKVDQADYDLFDADWLIHPVSATFDGNTVIVHFPDSEEVLSGAVDLSRIDLTKITVQYADGFELYAVDVEFAEEWRITFDFALAPSQYDAVAIYLGNGIGFVSGRFVPDSTVGLEGA